MAAPANTTGLGSIGAVHVDVTADVSQLKVGLGQAEAATMAYAATVDKSATSVNQSWIGVTRESQRSLVQATHLITRFGTVALASTAAAKGVVEVIKEVFEHTAGGDETRVARAAYTVTAGVGEDALKRAEDIKKKVQAIDAAIADRPSDSVGSRLLTPLSGLQKEKEYWVAQLKVIDDQIKAQEMEARAAAGDKKLRELYKDIRKDTDPASVIEDELTERLKLLYKTIDTGRSKIEPALAESMEMAFRAAAQRSRQALADAFAEALRDAFNSAFSQSNSSQFGIQNVTTQLSAINQKIDAIRMTIPR